MLGCCAGAWSPFPPVARPNSDSGHQQIYHVKETPRAAPGNLDLNISDEEEFSPDKLRSNVERFYMEVIIRLLGAVKHVARLRSWRERRRTTVCCVVRRMDMTRIRGVLTGGRHISLRGPSTF